MDAVRLPGFVWTALIAAATAGLLALGDGLAGVADWWAPLAVALVGAALKGLQEATAKNEVVEILDADYQQEQDLPLASISRDVAVTKIELELPPFWVRWLLG